MNQSRQEIFSKLLPWLVIAILLLAGAVFWRPVLMLIQQPDAAVLQAEVDRLGVLAPLGFFALSVIQIVGAPIPGYPVQLLGGVLFGTWIGGIYNVVGMLAGGLTAAWLARTLGRPFIEKQVGVETVAKYENRANLESLWIWLLLLTIPLGDFPYYIAGLSRVKYGTLALAILISRGPFSFVISWAGATSLQAPPWVLWTLLGVILVIIAIGYFARNRITLWFDRLVLRQTE